MRDQLAQRCRYCARPGTALGICAGCAADLPWNRQACPRCALPQGHDQACARCARRPPPFDAAWTAFRLEIPVQHAIHRLKYHASFSDARLLGELLAFRLRERATPLPELLIPVPLHRERMRRRGYNQAQEVGRVLGSSLRIPLEAGAVQRCRATADQIGMTARERRRNVRGAFTVGPAVAGRDIALLDDVMTTGATLGELARACRAAGARRIEAWAIARVQ